MSRLLAKYFADVLLWSLLTPVAFLLRLESGAVHYLPEIGFLLLVGLVVKGVIVYQLGWYRRSWRRSGVRDMYSLAVGILLVTVVFWVIGLVAAGSYQIPRSIPVIEGMMAVLVLGGLRMGTRLTTERWRLIANGDGSGRARRRVAVVGAGEAGVMAAREMLRHPEAGRKPVVFVDDDRSKWRERFLGLDVEGPIEELPRLVARHGIQEVLIAMPSQDGSVVRRVVELARESRVDHRIIPAIHDLLSGQVSISEIREVDVEDLLRRESVELETDRIAGYLERRVVLVTGAGGSIGSEIVRQVAAFGPEMILLVGRGENSIFDIDRELARTHPEIERRALVMDVRDRDSLETVFDMYRPEVVFHAAAHKHVPLMEANPEQAVLNNVGGTKTLVELSLEHDVRCFVNVSTDKAVNPTSVMGTSKRIAELVVHRAAKKCVGKAAYVSVRFGNVLGSRGSVVPLFKEQIRKGGPVTVTHPDMQRYFMTIPEATQLVLQAGSMGLNGAVCVLDMGEPVRIADLAHDLIMLCGKKPGVDVEITYSGVRPGEKLFEELMLAEEGTLPSAHEKIFVARSVGEVGNGFDEHLEKLFAAACRRDRRGILDALETLVPTASLGEKGRELLPGGDGAAKGAKAPVEASS